MKQRSQNSRSALALSLLIFAHSVAAQSVAPVPVAPPSPPAQPAPVVVEVDPGAQGMSADSIRSAVARELGVPVISPAQASEQPPRGTLRIMLDDQRRIVLQFRDASGREVWRTVSRPDDPAAALATIAFLAGNLARDEADELIVQAPPPAPAPPQQAPATQIEPPVPTTPIASSVVGVQTQTLPQQVVSVPQPTPDRHGGRVAMYAAPALTFNTYGVGSGFDTGASLRFARRWSVGIDGGFTAINGSDGGGPYTGTRWWVIPSITVRIPVGPIAFEFGQGIGVTGNNADAPLIDVCTSLSACGPAQANYTAAAFQWRMSFIWVMSRHFDLFARLQVAFDTSSDLPFDDSLFGDLALGVQARFL